MASQDTMSAQQAERPVEPLRSLHADMRPLLRHNLPLRQTSFVGRAMELAELAELLGASECRLLTLIGPGGIGKTRLAVEAAEAAQGMFADGIVFAPLQAVSPTESIAPVLAEALGCILMGQGDAREQVARFLRPMQLLLVIDNFEHLLGEAPWLGELLAASPGLRMLVTSREALNLREEWRYPLAGLATPPDDEVDAPGQFEAVRLFVERARQTRPDFSLEEQREGVVRLCGITEGMPLALELAAAWTKTLSCAAIADEIERNITFLSSDLRNVPARHRSMQAAFDNSWALLTEDERRVFQQLAVFRGGFRREAAEQASGATLPLLSALVDKSLVRAGIDGRFYLHELLRQYAEEHLRADPVEATRVYAAHRIYYMEFLASRFGPITGGGQPEATAEIATELDNIRAAWWRAAAAGDIEALGRCSHTLTLFFDFRARDREGLALLEEGLRVVRSADPSPPVDRILAAMLVDIARFHHRLLRLPAMRAALTESEEIYTRLGKLPSGLMTDPQVWRAILALIDGQYAEADRLAEEAIQRNAVDDRRGNLSPAWWVRAAAALWQEDTDAADEFARQSAETTLAAGDRWHLAYCRNLQGHVATARGDYTEARRHYETSYDIRAEFDDPEGMAAALGHLAKLAVRQGDWEEAELLYHRSFSIARDIGDQSVEVLALNGLGLVACATGDYLAAGNRFAGGLRLANETRHMRVFIILLASAGDWLLQTCRPGDAILPLLFAHTHPASDHETRARAHQLLSVAAADLSPEAYAAAVERSRDVDPAELATALIPLLTAPLPAGFVPVSPLAVAQHPGAMSALVEPLTARELSVLRLMAAGHADLQIADELFLAVNTIRSYNQRLYGKLGVSSRTQAVARGRELGLLD